MAVPPMKGAKLNTAVTLGFAAVQVLASAEQPTAWALNQLIFGSGDQGPVHSGHHDQQHDERHPGLQHLAGLSPWPVAGRRPHPPGTPP